MTAYDDWVSQSDEDFIAPDSVVAGFTGTQKGLTVEQGFALLPLLLERNVGVLHHGDCVGADADAHVLARGVFGMQIVAHPPEDAKKRAYMQADLTWAVRPYLERNQAIVRRCNFLIACPGGPTEVLRSGTWATVRFARAMKREIVVIWPDGRIEIEVW